jgi:hypothetical protein
MEPMGFTLEHLKPLNKYFRPGLVESRLVCAASEAIEVILRNGL